MNPTTRQRSVMLAVGLTAVLALAACGSSGSPKAAVAPGAQPSADSSPTVAPTSPTKSTGAAVVATTTNAKFGSILVDARGRTLYTLTDASGSPVACTGQCATFWPPLLLASGSTTAVGASGVTGLGIASGGTQVTDNGDPLYRFSKDTGPGVANGDGIASFGGTWHVVSATQKTSSATSVPPVATTTPTTASSGGYGY